jgi:hypothetical protein
MRKTFAPLDDLLIERLFQPVSDLLSHRMGRGRGWTACFCLDLAALAWIVSRAPELSREVVAWQTSAAFCDLCLVLLGLVALMSLRTLFRRSKDKPGNALRAAMQPYRGVALLMFATRLLQLKPELPDGADAVMLVLAGAALYFGVCVERPQVRRTLAVSAG